MPYIASIDCNLSEREGRMKIDLLSLPQTHPLSLGRPFVVVQPHYTL